LTIAERVVAIRGTQPAAVGHTAGGGPGAARYGHRDTVAQHTGVALADGLIGGGISACHYAVRLTTTTEPDRRRRRRVELEPAELSGVAVEHLVGVVREHRTLLPEHAVDIHVAGSRAEGRGE